MSARPGLKMSELADASGISAATIKHYLREGLLGDEEGIVRTPSAARTSLPSSLRRVSARLSARLDPAPPCGTRW